MTKDQSIGFLQTMKNPLISIVTALLVAGIMYALGSGSRNERFKASIEAVDVKAEETKIKFEAHSERQNEYELRMAEDIGSIKKSLERIERQLK